MGVLKTFISSLLGTNPSGAWARTSALKTTAREAAGVVIGAMNDRSYFVDSSMRPVAVLGGARTGKDTCLVVPSLLAWRGSAVVTDVGGELFGLTEHWRRTGAKNKVYQLDFFNEDSSVSFNFLDAIPWGTPAELDAIRALAADLVGDDEYWGRLVQSLVLLFIIAKRRSNECASLHDVQQAVSDADAFASTIAAHRNMVSSNHLDDAAMEAAKAYGELEERVRENLRPLVARALAVFAIPEVAQTTRRSTFELSELLNIESPLTLYLDQSPWNLEVAQPLIRAFFGQLARVAMQRRRQDANLLLALNDVVILTLRGLLESSMGSLPHYGVKPLLVIHSVSQVSEMVWEQCATRVLLRVCDYATVDFVFNEIRGEGLKPGGADITPQGLMCLDRNETIVLGAGPSTIRGTLVPYYESAVFLARVEVGQKMQASAQANIWDHERVATAP